MKSDPKNRCPGCCRCSWKYRPRIGCTCRCHRRIDKSEHAQEGTEDGTVGTAAGEGE